MNDNSLRVGPDGQPAEDLNVNSKAVNRKAHEAVENIRMIAEQAEPWNRIRVERELARLYKTKTLVSISGHEIKSSLDLHGVDLSGQDLTGIDLSGVNLHSAKLTGTKLTGCRLVNSNLHGADLSEAMLDSANAVEANFHGACLCKASVAKTNFMKANFSECCHEGTDGLDVIVKSLTPAEVTFARHRQSEGFRAHVSIDEGVVRYFGSTLEGANVTGMSTVCKRRAKS